MNKNRILIILCVIFAVLAIMTAWWGMRLKSKTEELGQKTEMLTEELTDLNDLRDELNAEVDSLQLAYMSLAEENDDLKLASDDALETIRKKNAAIKSLKQRAALESNGLRAQIEELIGIKADLENYIGDLQIENDSLKSLTGQLTEDLAISQEDNAALASLNRTIQEELGKMTLATFKASGFRVEVEQKKSKATSKSRRAKKVLVSFDLLGVPSKYQGLRPLFLVITDDKGTPIKCSNPIYTSLTANGQAMDIIAVKSKEIDVEGNQRLTFNYDLEERLNTGYYRVAVYTDIGLLGASSFRLR